MVAFQLAVVVSNLQINLYGSHTPYSQVHVNPIYSLASVCWETRLYELLRFICQPDKMPQSRASIFSQLPIINARFLNGCMAAKKTLR
jgi:hypothetical protein